MAKHKNGRNSVWRMDKVLGEVRVSCLPTGNVSRKIFVNFIQELPECAQQVGYFAYFPMLI